LTKPRLRASGMDRSLSCPGSRTVVATVGQREGKDGFEGVFRHWEIATRLISELGATPSAGGLPPPDVPAGYVPPSNSAWIVDWAVRHVRETIPADWALMVETEFEHEFERWIGTGHIDVLAQSPDGKRIKAKDWKCVYIPVDHAESNDQVATYLVEMYLDWPDTEEIEFEICSPRLSDEERITSVTVSGEDLPRLVASLDQRVCEALDNWNKLKTGLKQCKFCVGCKCPAIQEEIKHMEMILTDETLAQLRREPDDAVLADFVIAARTLRKPMEDAVEMLHERLDCNASLTSTDGLTITRKIQRGDYEIPDPLAFWLALKELLPSDEQLAAVVSPSMTRIKDKIADHYNVPKKGQAATTAETIFDDRIRPLVVQGEKRLIQIQ